MQRRKFLTDAPLAATITATALGTTLPHLSAAAERNENGFVVKAGKSRFGETTKLFGVTPNDIKVSSKDTNGSLTIFEYAGTEQGGPLLHINQPEARRSFLRD